MRTSRVLIAALSVASFGIVGAACSDDDDDNPAEDLEEEVDLDPGEGTGLPSNDS